MIAIAIFVLIHASATPIIPTWIGASAQCHSIFDQTTSRTITLCNRNHMPDNPPLSDPYLNAIKGFEGYTEKPTWDVRQWSSGYGTRASGPNDIQSRDVLEQRFQTEIGKAASQVDAAFPQLPIGARAALTSLTYNAGSGWINSGLGNAVRQGDWAGARNAFMQYNRAGGQVLPGLDSRRAQEAAWLTGAQQPGDTPPILNAASMGAQGTPAGVPLFGGAQPGQQQGALNQMGQVGQNLMASPPIPFPKPYQFQPLQQPAPLQLFPRRTA
jgi:GH24 family phage-related lysozyme (muramidase)